MQEKPALLSGIRWKEWGDEAFDLAQKLDKPILLAIGATWCHWCHVMDHTSYADPAVVDTVNREFIPIRVDTDRRPDVNERYNLGGWPTTAFLTPRGDLLTGGTYVPPEQMRQFARKVADAYRDHKAELYSEILRHQKAEPGEGVGLAALPPPAEAAAAVEQALRKGLLRSADPVFGGFGTAPKFPNFPALRACLAYYYHTRDERFKEVILRTLDGMANGGLYDPVEGGFFRYSTTEDWKVPHFEKMTEDLAQFIPIYLDAAVLTGVAAYKDKTLDVIRYVLNTLYDRETGAFFGSQDADEAYYALPLDERRKRAAPVVDRTIYVNWNARMARAFLRAHQVLHDPEFLAIGLKTLEFLRDKCESPGEGMCHYHDPDDSSGHHFGWLNDQVCAAYATLDAYETTGDPRWLARAERLAQFVSNLEDRKEGGFRDVPQPANPPGHLKQTRKPLMDNAEAALLFLRLHALTGKPDYRETAERTLRAFLPSFADRGIYAGDYGIAVDAFVRGPLEAHLVGNLNHGAEELKRAILTEFHPFRVLRHFDPVRDRAAIEARGYSLDRPSLYLCSHGTCLAPITNPSAVPASLLSLNRPLPPA